MLTSRPRHPGSTQVRGPEERRSAADQGGGHHPGWFLCHHNRPRTHTSPLASGSLGTRCERITDKSSEVGASRHLVVLWSSNWESSVALMLLGLGVWFLLEPPLIHSRMLWIKASSKWHIVIYMLIFLQLIWIIFNWVQEALYYYYYYYY